MTVGDWYLTSLIVLGVVLQTWICYWLGRFMFRFVLAIAAAASVCRWAAEVWRVHGAKRPAWQVVPRLFLSQVWGFLCCDPGSRRIEGVFGTWSGVGRWSVYPRKEARQ